MARPGHRKTSPLLASLEQLATQFGPNTTLAEAVARLRQQAPEPVVPTLHRPFIDLWCRLWGQLRGGRYLVQPRDAAAVARLVKALPDLTLVEAERRIRNALQDPWFQAHGDLLLLCTRWNTYDRGPVQPMGAATKALRVVLGRDDDGRPVYAS